MIIDNYHEADAGLIFGARSGAFKKKKLNIVEFLWNKVYSTRHNYNFYVYDINDTFVIFYCNKWAFIRVKSTLRECHCRKTWSLVKCYDTEVNAESFARDGKWKDIQDVLSMRLHTLMLIVNLYSYFRR